MPTVGTGVMLQQPGVDTFLVKSVGTGDDPQLLEGETRGDVMVRFHMLLLSTEKKDIYNK